MSIELPGILKHFIYRDLVYIIGGGIVITSTLYSFEKIPENEIPLIISFLGIGIAYVIGYALQDIFSLIGIVTTVGPTKLCRPMQWAYKRFTKEEWNDKKTKESPSDSGKSGLINERIIFQMMIGATMTPCALVSSILLFIKYFKCSNQFFDIFLAASTLAFSFIFYILNWLKAAQFTKYS